MGIITDKVVEEAVTRMIKSLSLSLLLSDNFYVDRIVGITNLKFAGWPISKSLISVLISMWLTVTANST